MKFARSKADACLYFQWTLHGLVIFISWVDDLLCCGKEEAVKEAKAALFKEFDFDDVGTLKNMLAARSVEMTCPLRLPNQYLCRASKMSSLFQGINHSFQHCMEINW